MYPITTTTHMNLTEGDVFPNKAENCCRKYGKLRLNTRNAAIFMTDHRGDRGGAVRRGRDQAQIIGPRDRVRQAQIIRFRMLCRRGP